jgi:hypothetical protein
VAFRGGISVERRVHPTDVAPTLADYLGGIRLSLRSAWRWRRCCREFDGTPGSNPIRDMGGWTNNV